MDVIYIVLFYSTDDSKHFTRKASFTHTHPYADSRGCHARCQPIIRRNAEHSMQSLSRYFSAHPFIHSVTCPRTNPCVDWWRQGTINLLSHRRQHSETFMFFYCKKIPLNKISQYFENVSSVCLFFLSLK